MLTTATHLQDSDVSERAQVRRENVRIARGLQRQDPDLLDELIVEYQHRLMRFLLYLTKDRDLADDLFQETWMKVLVRGAQFKGEAKFSTWLYSIARNLFVDLRRKRSALSLDELCDETNEESALTLVSEGPSPFDNYRRLEDSEHVAAALLSLDRIHREVLVLRFYEELALEDIARITRAPLSTVKSRLYRGVSALDPYMKQVMRRDEA